MLNLTVGCLFVLFVGVTFVGFPFDCCSAYCWLVCLLFIWLASAGVWY